MGYTLRGGERRVDASEAGGRVRPPRCLVGGIAKLGLLVGLVDLLIGSCRARIHRQVGRCRVVRSAHASCAGGYSIIVARSATGNGGPGVMKSSTTFQLSSGCFCHTVR